MASYTAADVEAASKFAHTNLMIRMVHRLYEKAPHIASWLQIDIRPATHDDYYVPLTLQHCSKVITIKIDENLCTLLSCTPTKEKEPCQPTDTASYYYVGDNAYDVQCQPSCFNTALRYNYNEDGIRTIDVPQLAYQKKYKQCRIQNAHMITYLEKPFYRSSIQYEKRLNDMPTGFSRVVDPNPYSIGFTYALNDTYCKYYDRTLDSNGECSYSILETIADYTIGMTLINYVKSGVRMLFNNGIPFPLPTNLPPLPKELKPIHTLKGWRENINPDFVVPEIIDTTPKITITPPSPPPTSSSEPSKKRAKRSTTDTSTATDTDTDADTENDKTNESIHDYRQRLEYQSIDEMSNFMRLHLGLDLDLSETKIKGLNENNEILRPFETVTSHRTKRDTTSTTKEGDGKPPPKNPYIDYRVDKREWTEKVREFFLKMFESLTSDDSMLRIMIDKITQPIFDRLRNYTIKLVEKFGLFMAKQFTKLAGSIGTKVLLGAIKSTFVKSFMMHASQLATKMSAMFMKIYSSAASIVGIIILILNVLDLILSIWDPLGYNNLFTKEIPKDLMREGEEGIRTALQSATCEFDFERLTSLFLTEDEMLEINILSMLDSLIYLDSLIVNSEGSRIDKGPEINVQSGPLRDLTAINTHAMAERVRMNPVNYEIYNDRFLVRVKVNRYLNYIGGASLILSAAFMLLRLPLLTFVTVIIAVIVLALARLELQDDLLVDFFDKYTEKESKYEPNNIYGYAKF